MTVAELVAMLLALPDQDAEVVIPEDGLWWPVEVVKVVDGKVRLI